MRNPIEVCIILICWSKICRSDEFRTCFEHFDKDGSKSLSKDEARDMLRQMNLPEPDVDTLLALYDKDKDGQLQYPEFVNFLVHL